MSPESLPLTPPHPPPTDKRKIFLEKCLNNGWEVFVSKVKKLTGADAREIKNELTRGLPWYLKLPFDTPEMVLRRKIILMRSEDTRLSLTDAKISLMTEDARYFRTLKLLGEDPPQGYIGVMEAFRATLPWNRTGINQITIHDLTLEDAKVASDYVEGLRK